jgi:2'-hydroxyisoflavone reductase
VSSISVYADESTPNQDESAPVATIADPSTEEITGETYGALKALCEAEVVDIYGGRALIIRPGLIVGPNDASDRFTYWVDRVARGGEVLAPDGPDYRTQFVDVRDLAAWTLDLLERGDQAAGRPTGDVYNATGPEQPLRLGDLLDVCRRVSGSDASFTWADEAFLLEHGVEPWTELPLWIPGAEGVGGNAFDVSRALSAGLRFRPLEETVTDTFAWSRSRPADHAVRAGLPAGREAEILRAWHGRSG